MGFWSVSGCFLVFEREDKMCRKAGQKANFIKKCVLPCLWVPKAIYSLECEFQGGGL